MPASSEFWKKVRQQQKHGKKTKKAWNCGVGLMFSDFVAPNATKMAHIAT